jgi:hypothetical protein
MASRCIKSIVDLGCGDFRVARMFLNDDLTYVGVDVVEDLVARMVCLGSPPRHHILV